MANINKNQAIEKVYEYLEANGFNKKENNVSGKAFQKDDKLVLIYGDTVSFRECTLDEAEIDYAEFAHCTGIEMWDLKAWKEVLDAYKIIPITFQLKINMNRNQQGNEWIGDKIENFFGNVKTLMLLLLFFSFASMASAQTQVTAQMRVGYSFKTVDALVAPSLNFSAHNITMAPEMIINTRDDQPVDFGIKLSYQVSFVEFGAARYFALFSTDAYDKTYANGWLNSVFVAAHYNKWFAQAEYSGQFRLSIGVREIL